MRTLLRASPRRSVLFLALAMMLAAACYSSDYQRSMAANVSLLSDLSDKLADYCKTDFKLDDRKLSSEEMGEFYYAFNKASAFSAATPRDVTRQSHRDFVLMLVAFEKFLHQADAYRLGDRPLDGAALASLLADHEVVRHLAGRVTKDLRAEKK